MFGAFADAPSLKIAPGETKTMKVRAYTTGPMSQFSLRVYASDPKLVARLDRSSARDGDELTLTVKAPADWVELGGQNLVTLLAATKEYSTRRHLIVHANLRSAP